MTGIDKGTDRVNTESPTEHGRAPNGGWGFNGGEFNGYGSS